MTNHKCQTAAHAGRWRNLKGDSELVYLLHHLDLVNYTKPSGGV
jgi:hypothetical protein